MTDLTEPTEQFKCSERFIELIELFHRYFVLDSLVMNLSISLGIIYLYFLFEFFFLISHVVMKKTIDSE